jgi:hypothetical protein
MLIGLPVTKTYHESPKMGVQFEESNDDPRALHELIQTYFHEARLA